MLLRTVPVHGVPVSPHPGQGAARRIRTQTLLRTFWGFGGGCELWALFAIAARTCQQPPPPPPVSSRGERRRPGPEEQHLLLQLLPPLRPRARRESLLRGGQPALSGLLPFFTCCILAARAVRGAQRERGPTDLLSSPDSACRAARVLEVTCGVRSCGSLPPGLLAPPRVPPTPRPQELLPRGPAAAPNLFSRTSA